MFSLALVRLAEDITSQPNATVCCYASSLLTRTEIYWTRECDSLRGDSICEARNKTGTPEFCWLGNSYRFHGLGLSQNAGATHTLGRWFDRGCISFWCYDAQELKWAEASLLSLNSFSSCSRVG